MPAIARVMRYGGLSYHEALHFPTDAFLLLKKCSVLEEYMSTQEGREYLDKCKRLKQTEPDMDAVHKFQQQRGGGKRGNA